VSNNELPFVKNIGTLRHIHNKLKTVLYDVLFDLNLDESIYISNESEADVLSGFLATNCLYKLDSGKHINWSFDNKEEDKNPNIPDLSKFVSEVS